MARISGSTEGMFHHFGWNQRMFTNRVGNNQVSERSTEENKSDILVLS